MLRTDSGMVGCSRCPRTALSVVSPPPAAPRLWSQDQVVLNPNDGIAVTPEPPYVAGILTSLRSEADDGYAAMSAQMANLATKQPGYLGVESAAASVYVRPVST